MRMTEVASFSNVRERLPTFRREFFAFARLVDAVALLGVVADPGMIALAINFMASERSAFPKTVHP